MAKGKTKALRKLIASKLRSVQGPTYHRIASDTADYPYKVYTLKNVSYVDVRDDFDLCIDLYYRGDDKSILDDLADEIEEMFDNVNMPQDSILPTFFRDSRVCVEDSDKTLQHIQMHFHVQMYET